MKKDILNPNFKRVNLCVGVDGYEVIELPNQTINNETVGFIAVGGKMYAYLGNLFSRYNLRKVYYQSAYKLCNSVNHNGLDFYDKKFTIFISVYISEGAFSYKHEINFAFAEASNDLQRALISKR